MYIVTWNIQILNLLYHLSIHQLMLKGARTLKEEGVYLKLNLTIWQADRNHFVRHNINIISTSSYSAKSSPPTLICVTAWVFTIACHYFTFCHGKIFVPVVIKQVMRRMLPHLLYIRMSGAQMYEGGILRSLTIPYSDSFQWRLLSVHSCKVWSIK